MIARTPAAAVATAMLALALLGAHRGPTVFDLDRVGRPAPDVVLPTAAGEALPVAALRGRPVALFLFASWCEPCTLELPWIAAAHARYGDRVRFIGVDVLESRSAATAFLARQSLPFEVAIIDKASIDAVADDDTREQSGEKYRLPAAYLIDADGVVRAAWHGVPVERDGTPIDVIPRNLDALLMDATRSPAAALANGRP